MRNETYDGTVGVSKDAQQINCTDEEAQILLRKDIPPVMETSNRTSGAMGLLLRGLLFNRGSAMFFGTVGYWFFGCLFVAYSWEGVSVTSFMRTGFHPLDEFTQNPFILWVVSFFMLKLSLDDKLRIPDRIGFLEKIWMRLGGFVMLVSFPIAYIISMLMIPIFLISLLGLFSSAPFEMGIVFMCALPWGFVLAVKLQK